MQSELEPKLSPIPINESAGESQIMISVSDTGIGIPRSVQRDLFHAFHQGSTTTAREYGGQSTHHELKLKLKLKHHATPHHTTVIHVPD